MSETDEKRPDVELRLPADSAYVSVLRATAATLAARLGFTLEGIEDLRIAVGEACALVLPEAAEASDLTAGFHLSPSHLTVVVTVTGTDPRCPDREGFAWTVLSTLSEAADAEVDHDRLTVSLAVRSLPTPW